MKGEKTVTASVTKSVQIARSAAEGYDFIANPETMPQWAIHNVKAIRKLEGGRWEMETPRGKATLIPHYEKKAGILDHEFIDAAEGVWRVTARIVPVGPSDSVYVITLPKPDALPAEVFEEGIRLMDDELATLKACIESRPAPITRLQAAMQRAMAGRPKVGGFPYLAETLRRAGVTRNIWFLPACESLYTMDESAVVMQGTPLVTGTVAVPRFDRNALIAALRKDQAGEGTFPEFLAASWRAGVVRYDVDFAGRTVTYYGCNGEEYAEHYPALEIS